MATLAFPSLRVRSRRLNTFDCFNNHYVGAGLLCEDGFFYDCRAAKLGCIFCGKLQDFKSESMSTALTTDHVMDHHHQLSPHCETIRLQAYVKQPLNMLLRQDPRLPAYLDYESRRNTFSDTWPLQMRQKGSQLAANGFIYSGHGDHVICFHQGCLIQDWKAADKIEDRHVQANSDCEYAIHCKLASVLKSAGYFQQYFNGDSDHDHSIDTGTAV